jgi:hypothetical protein
MTSHTAAQIIPAQPGVVARWVNPRYRNDAPDDPRRYLTRPVVAWALTEDGNVTGLVPSGGPHLVPVTGKFAHPTGDPVDDFADYQFPDDA